MKEIVISKVNCGQRADKFVRKYMNEAPLSFIYKLFRIRDVKVNGVRIDRSYVLKEGDLMQIYVSDSQMEEFCKPRAAVKGRVLLDILYEDENVLIVKKPSGLLVHGDQDEKRLTLTNLVLGYLAEKGEFDSSASLGFVPSPCHRLDRNTSGAVVFGKNIQSLQELEKLFKDKQDLRKEYLVLVCGKLFGSGKIDAPLYKDEKRKTVFVRPVERGGKTALTYYRVEKNFNDCTLLRAQIVTGRTHQIRVHFASIGHPVMGDAKYGNFSMNRRFEETYAYHNQFLHAEKISFGQIEGMLSYLSGKEIIAPLPEKEREILDKLEGLHAR